MLSTELLLQAYRHMMTAKAMAEIYDANRQICKYVHSTSRGHEAIQLATGYLLQPCDFVSPYYRDESLMLGMGYRPYELMLQLLAKGGDPFTGGREYYNHPNTKREGFPGIIHQSSATGMQAIPTTGIAQGIQYREKQKLSDYPVPPVTICSLGDGSVTEGEVGEALQFAVLKKLPIIYLVQDNDWGISVSSEEARNMDAFQYAAGFNGMERIKIDGTDFEQSFNCMNQVFDWVRENRKPYLVQARVPLLSHHTSGVRMEAYRSEKDLQKHRAADPMILIKRQLQRHGVSQEHIADIEKEAATQVAEDFKIAVASPEPEPASAGEHIFVPTAVIHESGERTPPNAKKIPMVDAVLYALREIMEDFPEAIIYGQDIGRRLG